MDKDYQDYKDFNMTRATRDIPHKLHVCKQNIKPKHQMSSILAWACTQDQSTRHYINEMIRGLMVFQQRKAIS